MFEETQKEISPQRRCAQLTQLARLGRLEKMAPCGLHSWAFHEIHRNDPCWIYCVGEALWGEPVVFDENKKSRSF